MASGPALLLSRPKSLSIGEMAALADRLENRATSLLMACDPSVSNDMLLASQTLRQMIRSMMGGTKPPSMPN